MITISRVRVGFSALLVLASVLVFADSAAARICPSTSAEEPGLVPGIGYVPPAGSQSCLFRGLNGGPQPDGCYPMDLGADPFQPRISNAENLRRSEARYGPNFNGTDTTRPRYLGISFENLFNHGDPYLQRLCCANAFGTVTTHSCYPTQLELHDYFAVNWHVGGAITGAIRPPQPRPTPRPTATPSPQPTPEPTVAPTPAPTPQPCPSCPVYERAVVPPDVLACVTALSGLKGPLVSWGSGRKACMARLRRVLIEWEVFVPSERSTPQLNSRLEVAP